MNSLRKSSKSLKRFINTKGKDQGLKASATIPNNRKDIPAPPTTLEETKATEQPTSPKSVILKAAEETVDEKTTDHPSVQKSNRTFTKDQDVACGTASTSTEANQNTATTATTAAAAVSSAEKTAAQSVKKTIKKTTKTAKSVPPTQKAASSAPTYTTKKATGMAEQRPPATADVDITNNKEAVSLSTNKVPTGTVAAATKKSPIATAATTKTSIAAAVEQQSVTIGVSTSVASKKKKIDGMAANTEGPATAKAEHQPGSAKTNTKKVAASKQTEMTAPDATTDPSVGNFSVAENASTKKSQAPSKPGQKNVVSTETKRPPTDLTPSAPISNTSIDPPVKTEEPETLLRKENSFKSIKERTATLTSSLNKENSVKSIKGKTAVQRESSSSQRLTSNGQINKNTTVTSSVAVALDRQPSTKSIEGTYAQSCPTTIPKNTAQQESSTDAPSSSIKTKPSISDQKERFDSIKKDQTTDEMEEEKNKKEISSSISVTSATVSVQSTASRGSALAHAGRPQQLVPPQRAHSTSVLSLSRGVEKLSLGLPPRPLLKQHPSSSTAVPNNNDELTTILDSESSTAKLVVQTPKRYPVMMMDHDETSTIATSFTTPISYVEFSANDHPAKLHSPNDSHMDALAKLIMVDLQSTEASTVLTALETLAITDAESIVKLQSAVPILIAMRRWLSHAEIQAAGLTVLETIAADHLDFCETAVQWGALQVCLAALQNHPRCASVQKHGCGALVQLVVADAHKFVIELNGVQIVTQTAVPHAPKYVVFLLQYLSYWQEEFKTKLIRDGGLQALAEIVEGSSGNLHKAAKTTMQRLL